MSLPSLYLDAFAEVARLGSFSKAAKSLAVTQSALSQRIKNLEEQLNLTLLMRKTGGVVPTEEGEKLLRYCQVRDSLEGELLGQLSASDGFQLAGRLRIGAHSSILKSVILKSLAPTLRDNPLIHYSFLEAQNYELSEMLFQGKVDLIVSDQRLNRDGVESIELGQETFVLIEPSRTGWDREVFLDHDPSDRITESFFQIQPKTKRMVYERRYLHNSDTLIEGVRLGLGCAIVSRHLLTGLTGLKIKPGYRDLKVPIYAHFFSRSYLTRLQSEVIRVLELQVPDALGQ